MYPWNTGLTQIMVYGIIKVVCYVAQEAGAPHLWVINRKNNNAIFTYP